MAQDFGFPFQPGGPGQTKTGNLLSIPQWIEYDFDPTRGVIYRSGWDAALSQNAYDQWAANVATGFIATRVRFSQGHATLEIEDSSQTYVIDSWSLGSNDEQVSVLLNPLVEADLAANCVGGYAAGVADIQKGLAASDTAANVFGNLPSGTYPAFANYPSGGVTELLYPDLQSGLTNFRNATTGEGYVLRHQTNVPNSWLENIADFNTGMIYTTAQLLSEIGSTSLWNYPCPPRLQYKISNFVQPPYISNQLVGFFKDRSVEETAAHNRVNITTEYTFGQWNLSLYTPIS